MVLLVLIVVNNVFYSFDAGQPRGAVKLQVMGPPDDNSEDKIVDS